MKILRMPAVAVASLTLAAAGGSIDASVGNAAVPPPPQIGALSVRVTAPSLPIFVHGSNLRWLKHIVFKAPHGATYAMARGYRTIGNNLEFWTPKIPPALYRVIVVGRYGKSSARALHVFPTTHFRAPWACPTIWNNYSIKGFRNVWISCHGGHWRGPQRSTSGPAPTASTGTTSVLPTTTPAQPTSVTPPPVQQIAPNTGTSTGGGASSGAGGQGSGSGSGASSGGGGTPPSTVATTMTLKQADDSQGALGGEFKNFTLTLTPSDPNMQYSTGTVTLGCATVTNGIVNFVDVGSNQPFTQKLDAPQPGSYTLSVSGYPFSHSAPTCGADPVGGPFTIYVLYTGGMVGTTTYTSDTMCAVPVVSETQGATQTNAQSQDNTAGCSDTGPLTGLSGATNVTTTFAVTSQNTSQAALGGVSEDLSVTLTPTASTTGALTGTASTLTPTASGLSYPANTIVTVENSNPECAPAVSVPATVNADGTATANLSWSQPNNPTCSSTLVVLYGGATASENGTNYTFQPDTYMIPLNTAGKQTQRQS